MLALLLVACAAPDPSPWVGTWFGSVWWSADDVAHVRTLLLEVSATGEREVPVRAEGLAWAAHDADAVVCDGIVGGDPHQRLVLVCEVDRYASPVVLDVGGLMGTDHVEGSAAVVPDDQVAPPSTTATATLTPDGGTGDLFGEALSKAADVDGDGVSDILVGARGAQEGYVFMGPLSGTVMSSAADITVTGPSAYFPMTFQSGGDLDSDGYADIVAGAYRPGVIGSYDCAYYIASHVGTGTVDIETASYASLFGEDESEYGYFRAEFGDINGDGATDVLAGGNYVWSDRTDAGVLYLQYGPFSGFTEVTADYDAAFWGNARSLAIETSLGFAVIPDWDGDGDDEFAVGSPYASYSGRSSSGTVWVFEGQP